MLITAGYRVACQSRRRTFKIFAKGEKLKIRFSTLLIEPLSWSGGRAPSCDCTFPN